MGQVPAQISLERSQYFTRVLLKTSKRFGDLKLIFIVLTQLSCSQNKIQIRYNQSQICPPPQLVTCEEEEAAEVDF